MSTDKQLEQNMVDEVAAILAAGDQPEPTKDEVDTPDVVEIDNVSQTSEGEGTDADALDEQPSPKTSALRSRLERLGYEVDDDADDEELADALVAHMQKLQQAQQEAERRAVEAAAKLNKPEPEDTPASTAKTEDKATEKQKRERKLKPIARPDKDLEALVEYDQDTKRYVGKEKFGLAGQEAAKEFNRYAAERAQRAELWFEDPAAVLLEEADEVIDARIEAKLADYIRQQQEQQQAQKTASLQEQQQAAASQWFEQHKAELYNLNPDGTIKKTLTGEVSFTEAGKKFRDEFNELVALAPNGDQVKLFEKAYRAAKAAAVPVADKKQVVAEKKKRFLDKRKHESGVAANANTATIHDKINSGARVTLLEALLEDPDNEDNPELAQYRK